MITEIKELPEDVLSVIEAVREAVMTKHTGFTAGHHGGLLSKVVRSNLVKARA